MNNAFDVHVAANNARDIRSAYMAQALRNAHMPRSWSIMVKAALCSLAIKAPMAGHRA